MLKVRSQRRWTSCGGRASSETLINELEIWTEIGEFVGLDFDSSCCGRCEFLITCVVDTVFVSVCRARAQKARIGRRQKAYARKLWKWYLCTDNTEEEEVEAQQVRTHVPVLLGVLVTECCC